MATLVALKEAGLPQPAAAYVVSPWADLSLSGDSLQTKAAVDPSLTPDGLHRRQKDYVGDGDPRTGRMSAIFADLTGLPPLLVQVGGNEILLDDATRLAARAATSGVRVTLEVTPDVPHVFVAFAALLDEAGAALDSAARFIRAALDSAAPDDDPHP
jgi:acetyl esterase/lipase